MYYFIFYVKMSYNGQLTGIIIFSERAEKGSHFGASWVDFKCLNTQDIVKQRILHHLRIPACELAKVLKLYYTFF